jgi:hypothetical protein
MSAPNSNPSAARGGAPARTDDDAVARLESELGAKVVDEWDSEALPGELSETAYTLPRHLTYERWVSIGRTLHRITTSVWWWWGDWMLEGERRFGDAAEQAAPSGYASETLRKALWVCERVQPCDRRTDLPFGHHDAVATCDPADQVELLARAAPDPDDEHRRPRLTVRELRDEVRKVRGTQRALPERESEPCLCCCGEPCNHMKAKR